MSSAIRDCGDSHRSTAEMLDEFLYEEGKPRLKKGVPGVKKEHSYEELWEMLESIRVSSWDSYDDIKRELDW